MSEPRTAKEWAEQSEEHAVHMFKVQQKNIIRRRAEVAVLEKMLARDLENLNEVKAVFYQKGWEFPK